MAIGSADEAKQYLLSSCAHLAILLIVVCKPVILSSVHSDEIFSLPLQDKSLAEPRINLNKFRFNNTRNPFSDFRNSRCKSGHRTRIEYSILIPVPLFLI
jgi:hypothetical protein